MADARPMHAFTVGAERLFPDVAPDEVYSRVKAWLLAQPGKLKEDEPGRRLEGVHGRRAQPFGWAKDARKHIAFAFEPRGSGTWARASVWPSALNAGDMARAFDKAERNWRELLEEAWAASGRTGGRSPYAAIAGPDWKEVRARGTRVFRRGFGVLVVTLAGMFALIAATQSAGFYPSNSQARALLVPFAIGLSWSLWTIARGYSDLREARQHEREAHR